MGKIREIAKRLLKHPIFHPTRFYHDWQKIGISHYHRILHEFLTSETSNSSLILDLGSGNRKLPGRTISLDIVPYPKVSVVGDAHTLPFKSETFDRVVVQQVLEHVHSCEKVLAEVQRVLKPYGKVYIEVPLIYPVHDRLDFWRFTPAGLDILCQRYFKSLSSGVIIGGSSAVSVVLRTYFAVVFSRGHKGFWYNLGWFLGGLLTFGLKYLDELFNIQNNSLMNLVAAAHFWIGEK